MPSKSRTTPGVPAVPVGLLAARPPAAATDRVYYATDTGILYHDAAGGWVAVAKSPALVAPHDLVAGAFVPLWMLNSDPATPPPAGAQGLLAKPDGLYVMTPNGAVGRLATLTGGSVAVAPLAPTGVSATAVGSTINLAWTAPSGAGAIVVQRASTPGGPYTTVSPTLAGTATSYADTGLMAGTYYYVIVASNGGGSSPNSTEVSATATAASAYAAAVLADAPVLYARCNEAPGAGTVADSSGVVLPHTGTVQVNPGGSAVFGGTGVPGGGAVTLTPEAWIDWGDILDFDGRKPFTYEMILAPGTGIAQYARAATKELYTNGTGQEDGIAVQMNPARQVTFCRHASATSQSTFVVAPTGLVIDQKKHLACTYDGTTMTVYIAGVAVASQSSTFNLSNNTASLKLGAATDSVYNDIQHWKGLLAEFAVYDKALSAARVAAHAAAANL